MEILSKSNYKNRQFSFKSKNCPIKPFVIETSKGSLFVEEMKEEDFDNVISFLFEAMKNIIKKRPFLKKPYGKQKNEYKQNFKYRLVHCLKKEDGDNSTILIAKNSHGKVEALADLQSFDEIDILTKNGFKDSQTGYIQDCYVSSKFRNQGVGNLMVDKLLKTAEGFFSNIFLCSEIPAINFYKRAGFSEFDTSNPTIKKIVDYILSIRGDKDFVKPMLKTLTAENNWHLRMIDLIRNQK